MFSTTLLDQIAQIIHFFKNLFELKKEQVLIENGGIIFLVGTAKLFEQTGITNWHCEAR